MALVSRAVAVCVLVLLASATAASAATWRKVTGFGEPNANFAEASVARGGNGVLNVLWSQERSVLNTQVSANGKTVSGPHTVFVYDVSAGTGPMLLAAPDGGLRAFFNGLQRPPSPYADGKLTTATSADGVSWAVQPTAASNEDDDTARDPFAGTIWKDGTPMSIWGGFNGTASYHVGTSDQTPDVRYHSHEPNRCCVAETGAATDSQTGEVAIGYTDLGGDEDHVFHFVQPTTNPWFPPGPAIDIPGPEAPQNSQRLPMTGRSNGAPGIFVAYLRGTNAFSSRPAVWRIGAPQPIVLTGREGARDPSVAMGLDGRLWAFWSEGNETGEKRRIFAARSNKKATRFGATVVVKPPQGAEDGNVWSLAGEGTASGGALDLVANIQRDVEGDDIADYVTRVLPGITLKVKKLDNGQVVFTTLDAGKKLATTINFAGQKKQTGDDGKVSFGPNPGKYTAKATRNGYTPTKKRVKVPQPN